VIKATIRVRVRDVNKQHCEMLMRLLYFDLRFIRFELNILWLFGELNPTFVQQFQTVKNSLNELEKMLIGIQSSLGPPHNVRELTKITNDLENVLRNTCRYRYKIWGDLLEFIDTNQHTIPELSAINLSFFSANHATHLVMLFNLEYLPSQELVEKLENVLSTTINQLEETIKHIKNTKLWQDVQLSKFMKLFFGNLYQDAFTCQRRVLLLMDWLQRLTKRKNKITQRYAPQSISRVLQIKHLLFNIKNQCYSKFYGYVGNKSYIIHEHLIRTAQNIITEEKKLVVTPETILKELYDLEQQLSAEINDVETQLKNYSWSQALFSSSIRLCTESYYYKFSEGYFAFIEASSADGTLHNYPIFNVPLHKEYLNIFTILGSCILLRIDAYVIGWRGISCNTFNTLSQLLLPELESIIELGKRIHLDDGHVMRALSSIKRLLGLGLYIGMYAALLGFKTNTMSSLLISYITAGACQSLSGHILNKSRQRFVHNPNDHLSIRGWELFVQSPLQHIASLFGLAYLGPKVYGSAQTFFKPKPTAKLLSNPFICPQHPDECREITFKNG